MSVSFFVLDFKISQGGVTPVAPIDNIITPIDEPFFIKLDKDFTDGF